LVLKFAGDALDVAGERVGLALVLLAAVGLGGKGITQLDVLWTEGLVVELQNLGSGAPLWQSNRTRRGSVIVERPTRSTVEQNFKLHAGPVLAEYSQVRLQAALLGTMPRSLSSHLGARAVRECLPRHPACLGEHLAALGAVDRLAAVGLLVKGGAVVDAGGAL
jgi:hypothetical protein